MQKCISLTFYGILWTEVLPGILFWKYTLFKLISHHNKVNEVKHKVNKCFLSCLFFNPSHMEHAQTKISGTISVLIKAKQVIDHESLLILYCALVLPNVSDCAVVLGNTYKCLLHSLSILLKICFKNESDWRMSDTWITLTNYSYSQHFLNFLILWSIKRNNCCV